MGVIVAVQYFHRATSSFAEEQFNNALARIEAKGAIQGTDFFISNYECKASIHGIDSNFIASTPINQLNFFAAKLEALDEKQIAKLDAVIATLPIKPIDSQSINRVIEHAHNIDFYEHYPEINTFAEVGNNVFEKSGLIQIPKEWEACTDIPQEFQISSQTDFDNPNT